MASKYEDEMTTNKSTYELFLTKLDVRSLQLACYSGKYPEVCNDEEFWRQRLELDFVDRYSSISGDISTRSTLGTSMSYKETWIAWTRSVVHVFGFDYIVETTMTCCPEYSVPRTKTLKENIDTYFNEKFKKELGKSIAEVTSQLHIKLHEFSLDTVGKSITISVSNMGDIDEYHVVKSLQHAIERIYIREIIDKTTRRAYSLKVIDDSSFSL